MSAAPMLLGDIDDVAPRAVNASRMAGGDGWYTTEPWAAQIREALGGTIDLDPCAAIPDLDAIRARRSCVWPDGIGCHEEWHRDGLRAKWSGRVYVNPPYSDMRRWTHKILISEHACERVLVLAPLRPSSAWWRQIAARADFVGIPRRRIAFRCGLTGVVQGTGRCELCFFGFRLANPSALDVMVWRLVRGLPGQGVLFDV